MRILFPIACGMMVAACEPTIPDSGAGVGFESYDAYRAEVDAQLTGDPVPLATVSDETVDDGAAIASATSSALASTSGSGAPLSALNAEGQQTTTATTVIGATSLSDEQDFTAVSGRETIDSDQERRAAQQEQYQVVEAQALPTRDGSSGSNIVAFALATSNAVGQSVHRRSGLFLDSRFARNCAKYGSPDLAQQAFLDAGGPESDGKSLDPDGDGFACGWDPSPYRAVKSN